MKAIKNFNELNLIKMFVKMLFIVFCFGMPLFLIKGLFAYMENDLSYLGYNQNETITKIEILIISIKGISLLIFYTGCYYLIKVLKFKEFVEVLSTEKIKLLKKAGEIFLFSAWIGSFTVTIGLFKNGIKSIGDIKSNDDFLFFIYFFTIIGLFLIIFSKVIEKAKELKQENDLTI